jgi:cobalamin biosynthesis protein CobT
LDGDASNLTENSNSNVESEEAGVENSEIEDSSPEDDEHSGTSDPESESEAETDSEIAVAAETVRPADIAGSTHYSLRRRVTAPKHLMVIKTRSKSSSPREGGVMLRTRTLNLNSIHTEP